MKTKIFSIVLFLTFFTLVAQVPSYVPTNGLVGYWPFSGNANDLSGNNNNGIVNGATLTTDRFGNVNSAYSFDGNDFIQAPNYASNSSFTVSCWVNLSTYNLNSLGSNDFIFFANHSGINNSSRNFMIGYRNFGNENGFSSYIYNNTDVQLGGYATNQTPPSVNSWHNLVSVFENGTYIKMYLDGVLFYNQTSSVPTQNNMPNLPLFFGIGVATQFDFLKGKLDDIGFWNRALTAQEIANLYNPCATPPAAPVASASQTFCATPAPTVADLVATGTGVQWYDAATGGNLLVSTATLTNGQIAYASQTVSGCESSTRTAVTVSLNDPQITASATTVCSGTAVTLSAASTTVNPLTCNLPTNLQNGLVGYWPFCGNANDTSGNNNNGTVNGATLTTDRFGNTNSAYTFNGSSDYISIEDNNLLDLINNFTMSGWYFTNNPTQLEQSIIGKGRSVGGSGYNMLLNSYFDNTSSSYIFSLGLNNGPSNGGINFPTSQSNLLGWHNIIATYDGVNVKLYFDGILQVTSPLSINLLNSSQRLFIGRELVDLPRYFNGKLDDIAIYNRALSNTEVSQLYSALPTYTWSTGETTATINPTPTATTTYWCDVMVNGMTCRKSVTITVNPIPSAPTGAATQTFCATPAPTVADLVATGTGIQWYDAATGGNLLASTATLTNGQTVYASQTVSGCESTTRLASTINFNDPQITASATTVCMGTTVNLSATSVTNPLTCNLPTNLLNGLVSYWPFCGNANDVSGNNNNGTVNGATLTTDRYGNADSAYYFNGLNCDTRIDAQVNTSSIQTGLTISTWVLKNGDGCSNPRILEFWPSNNLNGPGMAQWRWSNGVGVQPLYIGSTTTSSVCNNLVPGADLNTWIHIVYTNDGINGKFYQNGVLIAVSPSTGNPILAGSAAFGRMNHPSYDSLNGKLDDIGVWNRALSLQEIQQLYIGTTYLWSTGETTATINPTPTTTTTYWCDVTVNGVTCRKNITITVKPLPALPTVTTPVTYCQNATATALSATGTALLWYTVANGGTGSASAPTPVTTTAGTTSYYVSQTLLGCEGPRETLAVTVNATPVAPTGAATQTFCATPAATIADLVATGTGVQWYDAATGGNLLVSTATLTNGQIAYASQTVSGCESSTRTAVTVSLNDPQITASATTVCSGTAVTLSAASTTVNPLTCNLPTNLQNGLVGYWPFCGNANDNSGNNNNGTVNGATLTTDRFGNANSAFNFDFINNNLIRVPHNPTLNLSPNYTISVWFNSNQAPPSANNYTFVSKHDNFLSCCGNNVPYLTAITWNANGSYQKPFLGYAINGNYSFIESNTLISINNWQHYVVVSNNNMVTMYLDGVQILNSNFPFSNGSPNTEDLLFGSTNRGPGLECMNGKLDDIAIYNRALSPAEIAQLYTTAPTYLWSTGETTASINPTPTATTTYWCDVTVNGVTCRKEIEITVNSYPALPTVTTPVTYCQNDTAAALTAIGTDLLWYTAPNNGTGSATAPTPDTTIAGTTSYYISQTLLGCEGPRAVIDVVVNPTPALPTVTTPITYCQNDTAAALTATGTDLLWYTAPNNGTGSATAPTPVTTTAGTTTYYVSQTLLGCEGPRAVIDVVVNPTPALPTVTTPVTYCQNATATALTATGTDLLWYTAPNNGTGSATAPTPVTTTAGTTSYYVSQTLLGCEGPRAVIDVVVNPTPALPTVTTPITFCQNDTAAALTATGTDLLWYTAPNNGTGSATAPTPDTTSAGTTSFYVSQTLLGCEGQREVIDVVVNPTPALPTVTTPVTYCQNDTAAALSATGAALLWYTVANGGTGSASAPTPDTTSAGTTSYYISQTLLGCEGPRAVIDVVVNPTPALPTVTTPITYCQNDTAAALTAIGTDLLWYTAPNNGTGSATAPTPDTTIAGTTSYYVSQTLLGCEGPREVIDVVVNPTPALPTVTTPVTYCQNDTAAALSATGAALLWYTVANGGTGSTTAPTPDTTSAGTTSYYVSQTLLGCEGPRAVIDVVVNATPAPTGAATQTFCATPAPTVADLVATGTGVQWYDAATGGNLLASTATLSNGQIAYASQTDNGCESTTRTAVTVSLNDPQITASATTVCSGNAVTLSASTTVNPLTCNLPTNLQNGLVGYWPFCGNANDSSGNNNNGTVNGATLTTDRFGNADSAYSFDGNDVITTNINRGTMGNYMSISCFYKFQNNSVNNYEAIIGGNDSNGTEIFIGKDWENPLNIGVQDGNYNGNFVTGSNAFDGNWHHIIYTYENNIGKIYLDGQLSSTGNFTRCNDAEIYNFGSEYEGSGYFFHGTIDDIGFWNRVLSDTEITQLYSNNQTTYLWSTGETTASINPTPTATTTYWCDVTINGVTCRKEIEITVNTTPAPTVITPVTYCQNSVAAPLTATGANFMWYTDATGGTGTSTAPTPDTTTPGSTTWYVSQSVAGCESTREAIVINVTPSPAPPLVTTPLVYCQNSSAIPLAATGTNLLWYTAPNAGIGSATAPTPSTSAAGSTFYYVSQTVFGCESPRETIEVSITPTPPTPVVTSPLTYCQYSNAVPLAATGTDLLWYTASIGGSGTTVVPTPVTTFPGVRNYFVSQTISGCESPRTAIEVTITAVPFPPAVTNQVNYCQNSIATPLTATGTNLLWYTTATGGTGSATAPTPDTTTAGITNYYVSQTVAGCEGSRATIIVRVIATPIAPPVLTPVTFCQYSTTSPLNALGPNLLWYTDPNLGTGSITAPTPDTATAGTTTYYVSQSISGCEGPRSAIEVIISAAPSEPTVTTPVTYCQNSVALPLTATGSNLLWYTAATGGTGAVLAPTPITTITGNTTYYVSQTVLGCESLRTAIDVIINAAPLEPTGNSSQYFCANIYPTIQNLVLNQNSINWYSSATSSTALAPNTPLIPNTIYYAEQFDIITGCQSLTRLAVTVFIINENAPTIVDDLTFCEADEKTIGDINTNGAIVIWYDTPAGGTPLSSDYLLVNSQVLYAATYNSTSGCESLDRQTITITTFDCEVKANNLLTLDGNNLNDNLNLINIESFPANEIEIYNRYGQLVWRTDNYNNTTNTFKGRANYGGIYRINDNLPTGTYYYVLKYFNPYRNKYEVTKSYLYISNNN